MSAIEFVVRNAAGAVQRGFVGGETGSPIVLAQPGSDISLNLGRSAISGYRQNGDMLEVALTNGQVITIDDYFTAGGAPAADLYISTDGLLTKVDLAAGADGSQFANYVEQDVFGKWSPEDDLYFVGGDATVATPYAPAAPDVGMLAGALPLLGGLGAPLLGLLGLGTGVALLGGGDDKDPEDEDGGIDVDITEGTKSVGHTVNGTDQADGVDVGGTGTPGGTVTVVVDGHTQTTVVDGDGNWTVTFPPDEVGPGDYETPVTVTITDGEHTKTVDDILDIDTVVNVTFDAEATGTDGTVNAVEQDGIVRLTGTTDAGASVSVTINGQTFVAVVTGTSWHLDLTAEFLAEGDYMQTASVTATDEYGNTATTSGEFEVDTLLNVTFNAQATGGNGVVNAVEQDGVVTLSGTVDADATSVSVTINGETFAATITGTSWSLALPVGFLPEGETFSQSATVNATDDAGNTASTTGSFTIDTELDVAIAPTGAGGDLIVNDAEQPGVVRVTGTVDTDAQSVSITINGTTMAAVLNGSGGWHVDLPAGFLPGNDVEDVIDIAVNATDVNGNTATTAGTVEVDTWVNTLNFTGPAVGGDGVVNREEAGEGITLTGQVEFATGRASTVMVTFRGADGTAIASHAATVTGGTWTVTFPAGEIPHGEYAASFDVTATDHAGNTRTITQSLEIDTAPPEAPLIQIASQDVTTNEVVGFTIATSANEVSVERVQDGTTVEDVTFATQIDPFRPELTLINFAGDPAPNGSHLVLTSEDAAGNASSTLFVLDELGTNVVDVTEAGYDVFDVEAIDLRYAQDSSLTLTAADLESLSAHSNELTIHGRADDVVNVDGAVDTGADQTIAGRTYSVYSYGDHGGTLIIDDAITVNV